MPKWIEMEAVLQGAYGRAVAICTPAIHSRAVIPVCHTSFGPTLARCYVEVSPEPLSRRGSADLQHGANHMVQPHYRQPCEKHSLSPYRYFVTRRTTHDKFEEESVGHKSRVGVSIYLVVYLTLVLVGCDVMFANLPLPSRGSE